MAKAETAVATSALTSCAAVLDFDPRDVDLEAMVRTRRLLGRVLSAHGPTGLARSLHVSAPGAAQLKHRVACVTCRSRLDSLAASLASATASAAAAVDACTPLPPPEGPAPLTAWLAADAGRGLAPAPRALRDLSALAAFLTAFATSNQAVSGAAGGLDDVADDAGRKGGRTNGVLRCPYHATRTAVARAVPSTAVPGVSGATPSPLLTGSGSTVSASLLRERERFVALLRSGTSDAEWRQLGAIDIDDVMCDLFTWLGDRGLCSSCIDAVTGSLLEVRRAVASTATTCTCSRCNGRCSSSKKAAVAQEGKPMDRPSSVAVPGGPPEFVRVQIQGRLRAICGVYRQEPLPFNGRPVYKKERTEAYLLYTSLKDWMISGRADAGGSRCEGWAYVTDLAETPDEVCGVWKVSGPKGWEEDRSLQVTAFEDLPEELRAGVGYDDGSAIAKRLSANERGVLMVPLQEVEVLEEVLWAPEEPPPGGSRSGACTHILTAESAQRELRCWLRWLLRARLDSQRLRILAQGQVGASLCRLFACAALQQLEQAAETPCVGTRVRDKKGRAKKSGKVANPQDDDAFDDGNCAGEVEVVDLGCEPFDLADGVYQDLADGNIDVGDGGDGSISTSSPLTLTPSTRRCAAADSDESSSTRASSEEPPDARCARLATAARRLMEQMGWRPEAGEAALNGAEVAAWREQHPRYRQAIREEREKLRTQFQQWAGAMVH